MITSKIAIAVIGAAGVAAASIAVVERQALRETQVALTAAEKERAALKATLRDLEVRIQAEVKRTAAAEEENARLLSAAKKMQTAQAATAGGPVTADQVEARYNGAKELARAGSWDAALAEFLWCFDDGMVRITRFRRVRQDDLLAEVARIAQHYRPAAAVLRERRDRALARWQASAGDQAAAYDYAALNRALNEDARTLAFFDSLPKADPRRRMLSVFEPLLIDARRYADLLELNPYDRMVSFFATNTGPQKHADEKVALAHRSGVTADGAKYVEVLAGAGKLAEARQLAEKVLAYNNSDETRQVLQKHLERAGYPNLLGTATQ